MLPYTGTDAGISLFVACMNAGMPLTVPPNAKALDHCCHECDWLEHAAVWWPDMDVSGVDQKPVSPKHPRKGVIQGDVMQPDLYAPESFDVIVSLSAIEHIGLGHYGDPKHLGGDIIAVENCWRWLKPGGWLYFDVPYDPTGYRVQTTECRVYNDDALFYRFPLSSPRWVGYSAADKAGVLIEKPTVPHKRFYYVAMLWQKPLSPVSE